MKMSIQSILEAAASKQIEFSKDQHAIAGHNGPYFDEETPVRNTSHWIIIFSCLYKLTSKEIYRIYASKYLSYLFSSDSRPMNASYFCRKNKEKDFCNGLMGQAWVMEALLYYHEVFNHKPSYELAEEIFFLHEFDKSRSIWNRVGVDGSNLSPDNTFNHQLWFAAISSLLVKTPEALDFCDQFFENIATGPDLYTNGVLYHNSLIYKFNIERRKGITSLVDFCVKKAFALKNKKVLYSKSVGYHGFNLYAYQLLKIRYGGNKFYKSKKYKKMISVCMDNNFLESLKCSKYSFPYNPPGFELGFALLGDNYAYKKVATELLEQHFAITAGEDGFNSKVSEDIFTSEARLYELVRILDFEDILIDVY